MSTDDGLRFVVFNKANQYELTLSGLQAEADLVPNGISTASFVLDDDDPALPMLTAKGARCGVWFRGDERFRGRIREAQGEGPFGQVSATVESDMRKIWDWQGWPVPTAGIGAQNVAYRNYSGPAETVVKAALAENFARLGVPWTVAPTLGRGLPARAEFRFHPLADKLMPILEANRMVLTLAHTGSGVVVDIRQAATVPGVLTIESGVADGYKFKPTAPTATRVIVGGRGEGEARQLVRVIDTVRESDWGDIIETFVDARNTDEGSDLTVDGAEALREGGPRAALSVDLMESDLLRYGDGYVEGDLIHTRLGPVDELQQITAVSVTEDPEDGVVVVPHVGDLDVDADVEVRIAQSIARLAEGVRDQGRR
ncbi:hypothetical protein ACFVR6_03630 [Microbacterium sp. NPDC058021]|uniref:Gp37-like protein n=1 Tax=Microbacterium sp. NPDC058021 TaxID=3346306 RepID=UPI0036DF70F4